MKISVQKSHELLQFSHNATLLPHNASNIGKDVQERKRKFGFKENYTFKIFEVMFKLSAWFGIIVRKPSTHCTATFLNVWQFFTMVIHVVQYIISIIGTHVWDIPQILLYIIHIFNTLGVLIRFALIIKRNKISIASDKISTLGTTLNFNSKKHLKNIRIQMNVYYVWIVAVSVIIAYIIWTFKITKLNYWWILGLKVEMQNYSLMIYFIRFSTVYCLTVTVGILCLAMMYCCNIYILASNMVKSFNQAFERYSLTKKYSKRSLLSYIALYERLVVSFKDMDEGISSTCFLLYTASVTSLFGSVSVAVSEKDDNTIIMTGLIVLGAILFMAIFFSLTYTGTYVSSQHENLKMKLIEEAESTLNIMDDLRLMLTFKILVDTVNSVSIYFTGANMFTISKGLILTTAGSMVTYGMIIFQGSQ